MLGLLAAVAVLASAWVFATGPAGATASHPGGVAEMCPEVLKGAPSGELKKETDPPDGSEVRGGDVIKVKLLWDETRYDGPKLHKALDCVTLDGDLAPDLSVEERDAANDGVFEHSYTVPKGLPEGTVVCDRGFVSGPGREEEFKRAKSNKVCFPVVAPSAGESAPPAPPPTPPAPAPPPIAAGPAGGPVPPRVSAEAPTPAAQVQPGPQPAVTLPRTGSDSHVLVLFAVGALLFGALSVAARGEPASRLSRD
jgi:hypothetical protein